jgi:hypothetical protein
MADKWGREWAVDRQYSEEVAGRRVGWIAVTQRGDSPEYQDVHLVMSTVGAEGASIKHQVSSEGETVDRFYNEDSEGFSDTIALSMMASANEEPAEQDYKILRWFLGEDHPIFVSAESHTDREALEASKLWVPSPTDAMPLMKSLLHDRGLIAYYPMVYYTANLIAGHKGFRAYPNGVIRETDTSKLLMPDASMHDTTEGQVDIARQIAAIHAQQIKEDAAMQTNLTVFGDVPAAKIPDEFISSRLFVGDLERISVKLSQRALTYVGVYLRPREKVGVNMDASATIEDHAFERELAALRSGDVSMTQRELAREIDELILRGGYVGNALNTLSLLSELEQRSLPSQDQA